MLYFESVCDGFRGVAMMYNLFSLGTINLILTPVTGNCGIPSLYGRLLAGTFGVTICGKTSDTRS